MLKDIVIALVCGVISGVASGYFVYVATKRREEKYEILNFWETYLYSALGECEMYFPQEAIKNISKVGDMNSAWHNAILSVIEYLNPYGHEDMEFSDEQVEISENILIALKELYAWKKKNRL